MPLPDSVQRKFYHATTHFKVLQEQLQGYYKTNPCKIVREPDSPLDAKRYDIITTEPVPARFGLIIGDFLQNLRSSLDYLVWELVLANNETPDTKNMFPICLTGKSFKDAVKGKRLRGIKREPFQLIDSLQRYRAEERLRRELPLAVLDELVNINKHRRVMLIAMRTYVTAELSEFENFAGHWSQIRTFRGDKDGIPGQSIDPAKLDPNAKPIAFIALDEGPAHDAEIIRVMDMMAIYIGEIILKQFQRFF